VKAECTVSVQAALRVAKLCLLKVAYNGIVVKLLKGWTKGYE
jgi:hypothetical protein